MAKNKTVKNEATTKETVAQVTSETVETVKAEAVKAAETVKAEAVKAAETVKAEAVKAAGTVKAEAAKAEAAVTEAAGQVTSFVKGRLEQVQRQVGEFEVDAQKVFQTLVSRLNVSELRGNPTVQKLEKQATWVGGEVRQRLGGLRSRMVTVVGGVASQSQVDALNRELDRLANKLDTLISPKKAETQQQPPPQQAQSQQTQQQAQ